MKWKLFFATGILCIVTVILIVIFGQGDKPSSFEIKDGKLSISGMFGTSLLLSDMDDLRLTDISPVIIKKTNGSGMGTNYKGEFLLKDNIKARLYIDSSKPPFVVFIAGETVFYLSLDTPAKTNSLYQQLSDEIGK